MKLIRPACAEAITVDQVTGPHSRHTYLRPGQRTVAVAHCSGCTETEAAVLAAFDALLALQWEHSQVGARLETGPAVAATLAAVLEAEPADHAAGLQVGMTEQLFGVPIVYAADLDAGRWRLVDQRGVIDQGEVPT